MLRLVSVAILVFAPLAACAQSGPAHTTRPPVISSPTSADMPPVLPDMTENCMRPVELIGQPRSRLETIRFSNPLRVLPPGSAATMDYSPNRTNIILDAQDIIREITCG